jgi:hypothetical protein
MTAGFSWRKFQIRNRGLIGIKRLMNRNHLVSLHILIIGKLVRMDTCHLFYRLRFDRFF